MNNFTVFLVLFALTFNIFANETIIKLENNNIKLWIEPEQKSYFKDGNFFIFDDKGMNEILAYKKTAELYKSFECVKCEKENNTLWYLVSFASGVVLGGLIAKAVK